MYMLEYSLWWAVCFKISMKYSYYISRYKSISIDIDRSTPPIDNFNNTLPTKNMADAQACDYEQVIFNMFSKHINTIVDITYHYYYISICTFRSLVLLKKL